MSLNPCEIKRLVTQTVAHSRQTQTCCHAQTEGEGSVRHCSGEEIRLFLGELERKPGRSEEEQHNETLNHCLNDPPPVPGV